MPESTDVTDEVLERRHRKCLAGSPGSLVILFPTDFFVLMALSSTTSPVSMVGLLSDRSAGSMVVPLNSSSLGSLEGSIKTGSSLSGAGPSSCLKSPRLIFSDTFNFATLSPSSVKPGSRASGYGAAIPWIGERWDKTGARWALLGARSTGSAGTQVEGRRPITRRWRGPGQ